MTTIRHIVFDIGNVLVHYDPELPFRRIIPDDRRRAWFLAEVCSKEWNLEQDRGRSWIEAEDELIARFPDEADNIRAFRRRWAEMVPYAHEDSVAILREQIATGRDVTLLSNIASDTFRELEELYPFLKETRGATVSGDIHLLKPDPAIFSHHTETFGLDPAATLFIDDSEKNVISARDFGWHAIWFEDAGQLRVELESFRLAA